MVKRRKVQTEKQVLWNTNKPGAWESYSALTDDNEELNKLEKDDISSPSEFNDRLNNIMNKVKYEVFGKVSFSSKTFVDKPLEKLYEDRTSYLTNQVEEEKINEVEEKIANLLVQMQREEYEKKLKTLNTLKTTKGKSAALFHLKAKVLGDKKVQQEAVVIEDPENHELIFDAEKIKSTSLNYIKNLLTNREPKDAFKVDLIIINIMHEHRMIEHVENEEFENFTDEDFCELLKNLKKKNKDKYRFILKGGQSFLKCLFRLFKLVWDKEEKPSKWEETTAHQLFKGKGRKSDLSNYRFIHTKEEIPKARCGHKRQTKDYYRVFKISNWGFTIS